jgi:hypothetical protein
MRKTRYGVAASLDGYIAGPNGEADWITVDPEVDFAAIWAQFDTGLMGRRTYEADVQRLGEVSVSGITTMVFSRTLRPDEHPTVKVFVGLAQHTSFWRIDRSHILRREACSRGRATILVLQGSKVNVKKPQSERSCRSSCRSFLFKGRNQDLTPLDPLDAAFFLCSQCEEAG